MEDELEVPKVLPVGYHKWVSIFSQKQTNKLPSHSSYVYCIKLVEGAEAPWGPLYGLAEQAL